MPKDRCNKGKAACHIVANTRWNWDRRKKSIAWALLILFLLLGCGFPLSTNAAPEKPVGNLAGLYKMAVERYASINSYIVRFRRREQVGGQKMPEELMLLKFRKTPFSVYFKWLAGDGKGREVVYVKGHYDDRLHTRVAAGDVPLIPAGKVMSFGIDSPLVRAKSRHSISEAGIGNALKQFGKLVENMREKDYRFGKLKYLGLVKRPEFAHPVEAALQIIPPKVETHLSLGGRRYWYFDTKHYLPALLVTFDANGQEVEYYCYDRWIFLDRLNDDEFNPKRLWPQ